MDPTQVNDPQVQAMIQALAGGQQAQANPAMQAGLASQNDAYNNAMGQSASLGNAASQNPGMLGMAPPMAPPPAPIY